MKEAILTLLKDDTRMQPYHRLHIVVIIISTLALVGITYTTIFINNFKSPQTTDTFFQASNAYFYMAEIVKADIRSKYPLKLRTNLIELSITDTLLNTIITPSLVERLALPVLKIHQKIAQLPLSFAENSLVLRTKNYTIQFTKTLSSLPLPTPIIDAGKNLVASVPQQIILIDTKNNPNNLLVIIAQTHVFFEHIQIVLRVAWIVFIVALCTLLVINLRLLKRLAGGLLWIFSFSGGFLFILSFLAPFIVNVFSSNPDPVAGMLKDQLVGSMVWYYFSLTRTVSLVYLVIACVFFLLYRLVPFEKFSDESLKSKRTKSR